MKFTLQKFAFAVVISAFAVSTANAQLCGTQVDCNWPDPTVGHWTFDDLSSGNAIDDINGNNGIWDGGAGNNVAVGGLFGGASQTNDQDGGNGQEHYTIPSLPQLDGATGITISLWFNNNVASNNNSTYNGLFMTRNVLSDFGGGGENWGIALENNNSPRHIDWRIDAASGFEVDNIEGNVVDEWNHVLFTWDGTVGRRSLFVNGTKIVDETATDGGELGDFPAQMGSITNGNSWDIGNDSAIGGREYTGSLDDIAVWNTAFSDTDAIDLYTAGNDFGINASKLEPPLLGDIDGDGDVDATETDMDMVSDLDILAANYETFSGDAERTDGDLNSDGLVNFIDAVELRRGLDQFGAVAGSVANVPEPSSLALLALFGAAAIGFRRS